MSSSRDRILSKLRSVPAPFEDAPARPKAYLPVTAIDDTSPQGLLARFSAELTRLKGEVFPVTGDEAARGKVLELLQAHKARSILAWDFAHIPVQDLRRAIEGAGIEIIQPETHDEFRAETLELSRDAEVGLTGADAAVAATGTLIVTTAPGKGRIPTVLAPVHIAVITLDQILPRLESWLAAERARGMPSVANSANICFITGPSRTGDIEMELILGVHGPGQVQVVVKQ